MSFVKEVNDWVSSHNPNPKQVELATNRASVCETCEFRVENEDTELKGDYRCGSCGCVLIQLAFKFHKNACQEGKWDEVDNTFFTKHFGG